MSLKLQTGFLNCSVLKFLTIFTHLLFRTDAYNVEVPEAEHNSGFRVNCTGGKYAYVSGEQAYEDGTNSVIWSPPVNPFLGANNAPSWYFVFVF